MALHNNLGTRMKIFYEQVPKAKLMRRTPVIVRIDGKSFHTFTKGFKRPFDEVLIRSMQETTKYLCENIQGCVLGYTQSDEISLILVDYQTFETSAWFDYEIQKMCSIAAGMTTMAFNNFFRKNAEECIAKTSETTNAELGNTEQNTELSNMELTVVGDLLKTASEAKSKAENQTYINHLLRAISGGAMFDARVFNIPKEEVTNCIYWRQLDAIRNSILMAGQANFRHKELQCRSCNDVQNMLMEQKGIDWNDFPTYQKRGSCVVKEVYIENNVERNRWMIDKNIPIFKGDGRDYIEKLIMVGE